jgi:hypothetical protein
MKLPAAHMYNTGNCWDQSWARHLKSHLPNPKLTVLVCGNQKIKMEDEFFKKKQKKKKTNDILTISPDTKCSILSDGGSVVTPA